MWKLWYLSPLSRLLFAYFILAAQNKVGAPRHEGYITNYRLKVNCRERRWEQAPTLRCGELETTQPIRRGRPCVCPQTNASTAL